MADDQQQAAQRILDELTYWRAALEDLNRINDLAPNVAEELVQASTPLVALAFVGGTPAAYASTIGEHVLTAMHELGSLGPLVASLIELAGGRLTMLREQWKSDYPDRPLDEPRA